MNNTDSLLQEKLSPQLEAPHFDEETIANAQPVEPLSEVAGWRDQWRTRRALTSTTKLVLMIALSTTVMLALVLANVHQSNALAPEAALTSMDESTQEETADTSADSVPVQKPKPRRMKLYVPIDPSRPVPRKVGVIYYSH